MYYIGIDPDTKATGLALVGPEGLVAAAVARAKGRYAVDRLPEMAENIDLTVRALVALVDGPISGAAVELMHIRPHERNPNSIINVQAVAGMAVAALVKHTDTILTPIPSKWKGTVPKEIHQKRILAAEGLTLDAPVLEGIPKSMRTHAVDGIGLARWAMVSR